MTEERAKLYRTARVALPCAWFKKDEIVAVSYDRTGDNGTIWFAASNAEHTVAYPEHHLTRFVL